MKVQLISTASRSAESRWQKWRVRRLREGRPVAIAYYYHYHYYWYVYIYIYIYTHYIILYYIVLYYIILYYITLIIFEVLQFDILARFWWDSGEFCTWTSGYLVFLLPAGLGHVQITQLWDACFPWGPGAHQARVSFHHFRSQYMASGEGNIFFSKITKKPLYMVGWWGEIVNCPSPEAMYGQFS